MALPRSPKIDARALYEIDRVMILTVSIIQQISSEQNEDKLLNQINFVSPNKLQQFLIEKNKQAELKGSPATFKYEEFADLMTSVFETYLDIHIQMQTHSDHFVSVITLLLTLNIPVLGASARVKRCLSLIPKLFHLRQLQATKMVANLNFECRSHELAKRFQHCEQSPFDGLDPWPQYETYCALRDLKSSLW
jgi:hypothetical protein